MWKVEGEIVLSRTTNLCVIGKRQRVVQFYGGSVSASLAAELWIGDRLF
jgi:hypothetical protein